MEIGVAKIEEASALAVLAAETFPLACPPHTTDRAIAAFIDANLSEARFAGYLVDPDRLVLVARDGGELVGYTLLVRGEPADAQVRAVIRLRPTVELSKCYVRAAAHGSGAASALMAASLERAAGWRTGEPDDARATPPAGVWLGVNQENARAQRFYAKHGFERIGVKRFLVGEVEEDDFVLERPLP